MRRVSVVGSTGTGKTTFGRALAEILGVPFVELDAINWGPNWTMIPAETFQGRAREIVAADAWVVDGNYGGRGVRDIVWRAADTIVWLDYPLRVIYPRLFRRTVARLADRREIWPGTANRESFRGAFLSRKSLFWWLLRTHWVRRRNWPALFALPQYAHVRVHRFTRPQDADAWLRAQRDAVPEST